MNSTGESGAPAPHPFSAPEQRTVWGTVREALSGTHRDFTQGNLNHAVIMLAIPMILEMAMESLFAVVDAFFVARLGSEALATVGLTEAMLTLVYALALGLGMGTTALVARRIGEKRPEAAAEAAVQGIAVAVGVALVTGIPAALAAPSLLGLMGADAGVLAIGSGYARVILGTNIVIMLLFVNNAVLRGSGDAAFAMRTLWLANGINLVLDPCLIFGLGPFPEMGLTGAAVATSIGRGTGVIYQFIHLAGGKRRVVLARHRIKIETVVLLRLLRLAATGAGQFLVATASWVALVRMVSTFGAGAVAAYTLAIRILLFALLPAFGVSNAAATLVGQNLGAGKPERAERSVWMTGLYTSALLLAVMVVMLVAGEAIVGLFTDDPALVPTAVRCLHVISYGYAFYAWGMVITQSFNGAGDTVTPLWINLFCFWVLQVPLAYLLAFGTALGIEGIFWAVCASETISALVGMAVFRRGRWKTRVV